MSLELLLFLALLVTLLAAFTALHCLGEANLLQLTVLLASGFIQLTAGWLLFGFNEGGLLERIHGLLALIPTFMDLKGNLEMSMASRTSTIANTTEHLKTAGGTGGLVLRNMVLMQCQVTVMTLFAVAATAAFVFLRDDQVTLDQVVVLAAIGLITSFVTCTILGSIVTVAISFISRYGQDPDDMATSMAAASGDLVTVLLIGKLAHVVSWLEPALCRALAWTVTGVFLLVFVLLLYQLLLDEDSLRSLRHSSAPVVLATLISLFSGFIFEDANGHFKQITLLSPVFGGFVGNCVSIISSLLSTHAHTIAGGGGSDGGGGDGAKQHAESLKPQTTTTTTTTTPITTTTTIKWTVSCREVFVHYDQNSKISTTCRSHLLHVVVPCQFAYLLALRTFFGEQYIKMSLPFTGAYLLFSVCLLTLMVYLTCNLVHIAWKLGWDPDEAVIPINTSICDLFGALFLLLFYRLLQLIADPNVSLKHEAKNAIDTIFLYEF